jgi:hypothetical protein
MFRTTAGLIGLALLAITVGCSDDDSTSPQMMTTLSLSFQGVDPLSNGYHYEGWAIIGGNPISTGKFNVNSAGQVVDLNDNVIPNGEFETGEDLSTASAIVITIEPDGDTDTNPSDTHYLAGDVAAAGASLSVTNSAALGDAFTSASGDYILATPTNGSDTNENSGIWFLDLSSGSPAEGLMLPDLPAGWEYEGWAVIDGVPVTTGKFTSTMAVDFSAPYSGAMEGPPFPGEDFLMNAPSGLVFPTDISGGTAVISVEPEPDDASSPFTLKPLAGMIPSNAVDHLTYSMDNNAMTFPSGSASVN